ncbi:MAG: hypothetical protein K0S81_4138 [Rhodospirillales bacterium]|nr:hypothetical protein [Rhodospirillales bacterium]
MAVRPFDRPLRHELVQLANKLERLRRLCAVERHLELVLLRKHAPAGLMKQGGEVVVGAEIAAERHANARHLGLLLADRPSHVGEIDPGPGVRISQAELPGNVGADQQEVRLMVGRDYVLLALPGSPEVPLEPRYQAVSSDLVGDVVERHEELLGHQLHGQRRLDADERWRSARGEIRHQLHVDPVPRNGLDLKLQARRVFLSPLVHSGDRYAPVWARLSPNSHGSALRRLGEGRSSEGT